MKRVSTPTGDDDADADDDLFTSLFMSRSAFAVKRPKRPSEQDQAFQLPLPQVLPFDIETDPESSDVEIVCRHVENCGRIKENSLSSTSSDASMPLETPTYSNNLPISDPQPLPDRSEISSALTMNESTVEALPAPPANSFYIFDGIRIVSCTRLASILPLFSSEHGPDRITIELFNVESEPESWDEYSRTIRCLTSESESIFKKWDHLKFTKEQNKSPIIIRDILPEKETLEDIFTRDSYPLPQLFRFDGDALDRGTLISTLGLEDGDSVEIIY